MNQIWNEASGFIISEVVSCCCGEEVGGNTEAGKSLDVVSIVSDNIQTAMRSRKGVVMRVCVAHVSTSIGECLVVTNFAKHWRLKLKDSLRVRDVRPEFRHLVDIEIATSRQNYIIVNEENLGGALDQKPKKVMTKN